MNNALEGTTLRPTWPVFWIVMLFAMIEKTDEEEEEKSK